MFGRKSDPTREKKRRTRLHEMTPENDIRYRGPLSFQHFQLLGWLCIAISQVVVMLRLGGRIDAGTVANTAAWIDALTKIADLSLPFLLIANFAQILNANDGYRLQLVKNGVAAAAVSGLYYLVFYRYVVGGVAAFATDPGNVVPQFQELFMQSTNGGFLAFNIFIDLFLCSLTMLFLNYQPRRVFTGKSRIVFRLFALLPIAYEVGCMLLKVHSARGLIALPVWSYPLLTVKPPMTFVLFIALALFVKTRELRFCRHGRTHEEYRAFLQTRRNSWNFSVFLAIMLVIVSVVDFALILSFSMDEMMHITMTNMEQYISESDVDEEALEEQMNAAMEKGFKAGIAVGFGGSIQLIILAPVVLLFSYTRKPKYPWLGLLIPVASVGLILLIYLEGARWILYLLPHEKMDPEELKELGTVYASMLE